MADAHLGCGSTEALAVGGRMRTEGG